MEFYNCVVIGSFTSVIGSVRIFIQGLHSRYVFCIHASHASVKIFWIVEENESKYSQSMHDEEWMVCHIDLPETEKKNKIDIIDHRFEFKFSSYKYHCF